MVTDDERREVETRLRNNASQDMAWVIPWAVFNDAAEHGACEVMERLADLIEPPRQCPCYDSVRHRCSIHDVPTIDRDALLALASGLESDADRIIRAARNARFGGGPRMGEAKHDAYEWRSIARSIREALGVTVDDRL